jgi:hypothetical protein
MVKYKTNSLNVTFNIHHVVRITVDLVQAMFCFFVHHPNILEKYFISLFSEANVSKLKLLVIVSANTHVTFESSLFAAT